MGDFSDGIPSHDTINNVFSRINAEEFSSCFIQWTATLMEKHQEKLQQVKDQIPCGVSEKEIVAIDGKRIRNSHTKKNAAIHMVSALAVKSGLCLGQLPTAEKKNEISTIPLLLDLLSIKGCIVTIDAMGCQKKIAKAIREKEADYVLAVKDNQEKLKESIEKFVPFWITEKDRKKDFYETSEKNRGRIENRKCFVCNNIYWLSGYSEWKDLKTFAWVESVRKIKKNGEWCIEKETRYYISSLQLDAKSCIRLLEVIGASKTTSIGI